MALKALRASNNEVVGRGGGRADETVVDSSKFKNEKFRKSMCVPNIGATKELNFLTPNVKKVFNYLRLAFIKASIF